MPLGYVKDEAADAGDAQGTRQCERGGRVGRREQAGYLDGQAREQLGIAVVSCSKVCQNESLKAWA